MVDCGVFLLIYAEIVIHNSELFLLKKKMSRSELSSYFLDVFQVDAGKPREMRTKRVRIIDQLAAQPVPVMESDDSEVECLKVILIPKRKSKRKDRIEFEREKDPDYLPSNHRGRCNREKNESKSNSESDKLRIQESPMKLQKTSIRTKDSKGTYPV